MGAAAALNGCIGILPMSWGSAQYPYELFKHDGGMQSMQHYVVIQVKPAFGGGGVYVPVGVF